MIQGAHADTYTVAAADAGRTLVAVVSASAQSVLSAASPVVRTAPGPVALGRPTIAGTLEQGKRLTGGAGTWTGSGAIAYAYQWSRCDARGAHCATILGATRATYTEVAADVAHALALTVRATDAAGSTTAYSALAGLVAATDAILAARTQPSLAGIPSVGQTLAVQGSTYTGIANEVRLRVAALQCERPAVRPDRGRRSRELRGHWRRCRPCPDRPGNSHRRRRDADRALDGGDDPGVTPHESDSSQTRV